MADDDPHCLVERAVNARLASAMHDAATLLRARLQDVTLADVARDFETEMSALPPLHRTRAV